MVHPLLEKNKNTMLFKTFTYVLIICGSIIAMISNYIQATSTNSNQLLQVTVIGYLTAAIGILLLMVVSIFYHLKGQPIVQGTINKIKSIFSNYILYSLPFVLTIGVIVYICVILLSFKDKLVGHTVAQEYYKYSTASSILLGTQLIMLIHHLLNKKNIKGDVSNTQKSSSNYSIYILTILNITMIGIMQVILQYFSTDG